MSDQPSAEPQVQSTVQTTPAIDAARQYVEAQQRFTQTMSEAQAMMQKLLIDAYKEYAHRMQEAQRELETFAVEAYQQLLSNQTESAPGGAVARGAEAYQDYTRLGAELFTQASFREEVGAAYHDLVAGLAKAEGKPDGQQLAADANRKYVERLEAAWKNAQDVQSKAGAAYQSMVSAWNDELGRRQQGVRSAYQTYADNLKEAYARSDFEGRASAAVNDYLAALKAAWNELQNVYTDATVGLIDAHKSVVETLRERPNG